MSCHFVTVPLDLATATATYEAGKLLAGVAHITELSTWRGFKISKAQCKSNESRGCFKRRRRKNLCVFPAPYIWVNSSRSYSIFSVLKKDIFLLHIKKKKKKPTDVFHRDDFFFYYKETALSNNSMVPNKSSSWFYLTPTWKYITRGVIYWMIPIRTVSALLSFDDIKCISYQPACSLHSLFVCSFFVAFFLKKEKKEKEKIK